MKRVKVVIALLAMTLALSGCGQYKSLPTEERYQYINEVKENLDLSSAGDITSEGYDNGDGVFSPSKFRSNIVGENSYQIIKDRIKAIPNVKNCREGKTQITCDKGQVDIFLTHNGLAASAAILELTDVFSGRNKRN